MIIDSRHYPSDRKASLLMIYTGGTIGMKQDPSDLTLKPFNFEQILKEVPELHKFAYRIDSVSFDPIIDSSDIEPACLAGTGVNDQGKL